MRPILIARAALAGALALGCAAPALASWPPASSSGAPVAPSTFAQAYATAAEDGAHGAFVAWTEMRNGRNRSALFAQHLTPLGDPSWASGGLSLCADFVDSDQKVSAVSDGAGGVIVLWRDFRADTAGNLYAQRVAANGTLLWGAGGVPVCTGPLHEVYATALSDGAGGAYVAWRDDRTGGFEPRVQRLDPSGARQWNANGIPLGSMGGIHVAASDEAGGLLVAWTRAGTVETRVQRLTGAGVPQWPAGGVNASTSPGWTYAEGLAGDGQGGAYVLLADQRPGQAFTQTYAQHIAASGVVSYALDGANLSGSTLPTYRPVVTADGAHGAFIGWQRMMNDGTGNFEVRAARVTPLGVEGPAGGALVGTCTDWMGSWATLGVTRDHSGGAVFAWNGTKPGNTDFPVVAQRVNASLQPQWTPAAGVTIAQPLGVSYFTRAVTDGSHGAIAVWVWRPLDTWVGELRAQLVGGDGGVALAGVPPDAWPGRGRFTAAPSLAHAGERVTFWVSLEQTAGSRVTLFDVNGRRVRTLRPAASGSLSRFDWDARDASGARVTPGVYLARLDSDALHAAARVVITN